MSIDQKGPRRSAVVIAFAWLANLYLAGFVLDAVSSVADDLTKFEIVSLHLWREAVATGVVFASLAMIFVLLFVPQLPRRVFLPLLLFALWCTFGAPPVPAAYQSGLAWAQAGLAIIALGYLQFAMGHPWLVPAALPRRHHMILRTVAAVVATVIFVPLTLMSLGVYGFADLMEQGSGGYLDFTWTELRTKQTRLTKDGREVRILGMMHIAEPAFYDEVQARMSDAGLILAEGVSDREHRLSGDLSYGPLATVFGLGTQRALGDAKPFEEIVKTPDAAKTITPPNPSRAKPEAHEEAPGKEPEFVIADVDVSDFRDVTISYLKRVVQLYRSRSVGEAVERLDAINRDFSESDQKIVMDDVIRYRNDALIDKFDRVAGKYPVIVMPWGAWHMPGIKAALVERGYQVVAEDQLTILRYDEILRAWASSKRRQDVAGVAP